MHILTRCTWQGFTENNVAQLSMNLDWTPNRPVILAVHRYWIGKLQRQVREARQAVCAAR